MVVIEEMKQQQQSNRNEFQEFRAEINAKIIQLDGDLQSVQKEMQSINNTTGRIHEIVKIPNTKCYEFMGNQDINDTIGFLYGSVATVINDAHTMKNVFVSTANEIKLKIKDIERKEKSMEETLNDIIQTINQSRSRCVEKNQIIANDIGNEEEYGSVTNAIECVQQQVNKVNLMVMQDDEKFEKINRQLHVLSAKFVRFSS